MPARFARRSGNRALERLRQRHREASREARMELQHAFQRRSRLQRHHRLRQQRRRRLQRPPAIRSRRHAALLRESQCFTLRLLQHHGASSLAPAAAGRLPAQQGHHAVAVLSRHQSAARLQAHAQRQGRASADAHRQHSLSQRLEPHERNTASAACSAHHSSACLTRPIPAAVSSSACVTLFSQFVLRRGPQRNCSLGWETRSSITLCCHSAEVRLASNAETGLQSR